MWRTHSSHVDHFPNGGKSHGFSTSNCEGLSRVHHFHWPSLAHKSCGSWIMFTRPPLILRFYKLEKKRKKKHKKRKNQKSKSATSKKNKSKIKGKKKQTQKAKKMGGKKQKQKTREKKGKKKGKQRKNTGNTTSLCVFHI